MEGVDAQRGVQAALLAHLADPLSRIGTDQVDSLAALGSEQVEEPA